MTKLERQVKAQFKAFIEDMKKEGKSNAEIIASLKKLTGLIISFAKSMEARNEPR